MGRSVIIHIVVAWFWLAAGLFFGSFVQEDAAIVAGGYLVVERQLPMLLAGASLFAGVVMGDLAIYGLGALARRSSWLRAKLGSFGAVKGASWLNDRLFLTVAGCRLTPTLLFPTFAACGWLGVPFARFFLAVLLSATIYVPLLLLTVIFFGDALTRHIDLWGWTIVGVVMVMFWALKRRSRPGAAGEEDQDGEVAIHEGMPPLPRSLNRVAPSERINVILYYTPLFFQWIWLGIKYRSLTLPTAANPCIEAGGLLGESKIACLSLVSGEARRWVAAAAAIECGSPGGVAEDLRRAEAAIARHGLRFPLIAKPDIGWRGLGVRRVGSLAELGVYLEGFPAGNKLILQEYVPYAGEAGVFYVRRPGQTRGEIFSMTFRYYPFVVGDGKSSLRDLILGNPRTLWKADLHLQANHDRLDEVPAAGEGVRLAVVGSNRVGGLYVDACSYVTPELTARIDEICRQIPEFHFGRFDVRFQDIESFQRGENFSIIEVNGAGAEAIHIWDPRFPILSGYKVLFEQQSLMFAVADANRRRGFKPMTVRELVACQQKQQKL